MTAQSFRSERGHGWEVQLGNKAYWFGRGLSGYLLGPFATKALCMGAVAHDIKEVEDEDFYRELEEDLEMLAMADEAHSPDDEYVVYSLVIGDEDVGHCVDTPNGAIEEIFDEVADAASAAHQKKAHKIAPITPQF
jgi:hypothetical protein